ncbi:hypothetical protein KY360_05855 [Candidatus Woesearchaeota archaeon]|nr:hypothetical protein [Candidatus Woesearchaeota archaeon]
MALRFGWRCLYILLIILSLVIGAFAVQAQQAHPAAEVTPGTFGEGDYIFPGISKLGVGTTPTVALDVNGDLVVSGNVGIGETNPLGKLHIAEADAYMHTKSWSAPKSLYWMVPDDTYVGFLSSDGNLGTAGAIAMRLGNGDGVGANAQYTLYSEGSVIHQIKGDGTAHFSGNVGIGTANPTQTLDVSGNIMASGTICGSDGCVGGSLWTLIGSDIHFNEGKVGIGTVNPGYKLHVEGDPCDGVWCEEPLIYAKSTGVDGGGWPIGAGILGEGVQYGVKGVGIGWGTGVFGQGGQDGGPGVYAVSDTMWGDNALRVYSSSTADYAWANGLYAEGWSGGYASWVYGMQSYANAGIDGTAYGLYASGWTGGSGTSYGVYGSGGGADTSYGVYGSGGTHGVYGYSWDGHGVHGSSYYGYEGYFEGRNNYGMVYIGGPSGTILHLGKGGSAQWGILTEEMGAGKFGIYDYDGASQGYRMVIAADGKVGIGTSSPTQKLDVNGQIRMRGGSPGAGKVLTSSSDGTGTWKTLSVSLENCFALGVKGGCSVTNVWSWSICPSNYVVTGVMAYYGSACAGNAIGSVQCCQVVVKAV